MAQDRDMPLVLVAVCGHLLYCILHGRVVSKAWLVPTDVVPGIFFARLVMEDPPKFWRTDASEIMPSPKFALRTDSGVSPEGHPGLGVRSSGTS